MRNLPKIETLLLQEMVEVKGGTELKCVCKTGAYQGKLPVGECVCESGAAQTGSGSGSLNPCSCTSAAQQ